MAIFKSTTGPILDVRLEKETVWLSQKQMSELFDKDVRTVNEHIQNIFYENELKEKSVIRKFRITASDNKTYITNFYNLDVIISVGYRVKSLRGTQFRIWATKTLKQQLIQGYTINQKRLLQTQNNLDDLQETILFLKEKAAHKLMAGQESEILNLLASYSKTLTILSQHDKDKLRLIKKGRGNYYLDYPTVKGLILETKNNLLTKKEASDLFGQENGHGLSSLNCH